MSGRRKGVEYVCKEMAYYLCISICVAMHYFKLAMGRRDYVPAVGNTRHCWWWITLCRSNKKIWGTYTVCSRYFHATLFCVILLSCRLFKEWFLTLVFIRKTIVSSNDNWLNCNAIQPFLLLVNGFTLLSNYGSLYIFVIIITSAYRWHSYVVLTLV